MLRSMAPVVSVLPLRKGAVAPALFPASPANTRNASASRTVNVATAAPGSWAMLMPMVRSSATRPWYIVRSSSKSRVRLVMAAELRVGAGAVAALSWSRLAHVAELVFADDGCGWGA